MKRHTIKNNIINILDMKIINWIIKKYICYWFYYYYYCCYTNITYYKKGYNNIPTRTWVTTSSTNCYSTIITTNIYPDSNFCDGDLRNQGHKCDIKTSYKPTMFCNTNVSNYWSNIDITIPTVSPEIHIFKLNCKNKTSSSLISII